MDIPAARPLIVSAPMAEITDSAFRTMAFRAGADICVSEMISAAGLSRRSAGSLAYLERLGEEKGFTAAQLYGDNCAEMAEAAKIIAGTGRFSAIDLNAGCPAPKVVRCGGGSALIRTPGKIGALTEALVKATPLPVFVKTRIGSDPGHPAAAELARIARESGASLLTMHGRFTSRRHSGPVDAELLREAVLAAGIPVVVNGGIDSVESARSLLGATGAAGVMPGRAAVGRPALFSELRRALRGDSDFPGVPENPREALKAHLALLIELKAGTLRDFPDAGFDAGAAVAADFRHHLFAYLKGAPGIGEIRRKMTAFRTAADIFAALDR